MIYLQFIPHAHVEINDIRALHGMGRLKRLVHLLARVTEDNARRGPKMVTVIVAGYLHSTLNDRLYYPLQGVRSTLCDFHLSRPVSHAISGLTPKDTDPLWGFLSGFRILHTPTHIPHHQSNKSALASTRDLVISDIQPFFRSISFHCDVGKIKLNRFRD